MNKKSVIRLIENLGFIKEYNDIEIWFLKYNGIEYGFKIFKTSIDLYDCKSGDRIFSIGDKDEYLIDSDYIMSYKELRENFKALFRKKIIEEI